ncbi:hypothetical protein LCGC14_0917660 [marine sediment metagenome]|uniref:Calcineurin-like phosphoesterase domain-containing protein n=1 Tax=marine sediment metagenome TaxID=412755 RepID=A0A0F9PCG9_9ZZZZ|nr:hypothetical protein [bacterium]
MRFEQELLLTSDIHLGSNLTRLPEFRQFLDNFIRNDNYQFVKKIVFLGDLLELMLNDISVIMNDNEIRQIFNLLRKISNTGVELHYILGNHDISFIGDFEDEKEFFQNTLATYNCNIFHSISQFASFSFQNGFIPFDNIGEIPKILLEPSREPQYLFVHGHQFDEPLIKPIEQLIWAKKIKDDQIWFKRLCDYLKNYCLNCYLRNQGKFLSAWKEFKEFYYKIDKSNLSHEEIFELWKFKEYLRLWLLKKKLNRYPLFFNSYINNMFFRARDFLISNNLLNFFSHIIFGHTHIPGVYKPLFSNANTTTFLVLVNTGAWQQGEYRPHITRLSATSGINIYPV